MTPHLRELSMDDHLAMLVITKTTQETTQRSRTQPKVRRKKSNSRKEAKTSVPEKAQLTRRNFAIILLALVTLILWRSTAVSKNSTPGVNSIYNCTAKSLDGKELSLSQFEGKVLIIVNTASKCGFTPQYTELEQLYQKYSPQGLVVLGFPCDQFGHQEPGDSSEIANFCQKNYGVTFPMFEKIDVNGDGAHPLYKFLKSKAPGALGSQGIKWNFTKFLVDKDGTVMKRYAPTVKPLDISSDIERTLNSPK